MRRAHKILLVVAAALALLAAGLAWLIRGWGQPVPVAYRRVAVVLADENSGRSVVYLRMSNVPDAPPDSRSLAGKRLTAVDVNGDGTVDLVLSEGAPASFARPRPDDPEARWLILCLDGVPYQELLGLWEEGHFREFFHPVPLIPPFPTASAVALTSLVHTDAVAGYEDGYFDRQHNQLAGGVLKTTTLSDLPYVGAFDYDMPGRFRGLAYVLPVKSFRADLGRLRKRFLASNEQVFVAHIASTDSLYHVVPRAQVRERLIEVDSVLRELYFNARGKLRITLLSDHGNSLAASRRVPLEEFLKERGWRLRSSLADPRDVVVPAYGLVGYLAAYFLPEQRAELARTLATMEGADLAVYGETESVAIESGRGRARLEWQLNGSAFRYFEETGDPLELAEILAGLQGQGKVDADGWVKDADLFAATPAHVYPDPAYRLWQMATNHVRNPADVVVSLMPGYYYGSATFGRIVDLLSTHGSFDHAQSLGFALSTDGPLALPSAGAVRSDDLLPANLLELKLVDKQAGNQKSEKRK